ncbi:MAG: amidohydrolase family protein [Candidatus Muiribacteriota bacterium]
MANNILLKNALIPYGNNLVLRDILCLDGVIVQISNSINKENIPVLNCNNNILIPGGIDSNVNFCDPGFTHREDFETGTIAAVNGGITTVVDYSSSNVSIIKNIELATGKIQLIEPKAWCDFAIIGGISADEVEKKQLANYNELNQNGICGVEFFTCTNVANFRHLSNGQILDTLKYLSGSGVIFCVHAEDFEICDWNARIFKFKNKNYPKAWCESRPDLAEKISVSNVLAMAAETGARIHFLNISTTKALEIIKQAKASGVDVTCETNPYYLEFTEEDTSRLGNNSKLTPPLRKSGDRINLWKAISDGVVDIISSSHIPYEYHTEKNFEGATIWNIYSGTPETQFLLPYLISEGYLKNRLSLNDIIKTVCKNPARRFGFYPKKGSLTVGSDADFTIINVNEKTNVKTEMLKSKSKFSIFDGYTFNCRVEKVVLRGNIIFSHNAEEIEQTNSGIYIKRQSL